MDATMAVSEPTSLRTSLIDSFYNAFESEYRALGQFRKQIPRLQIARVLDLLLTCQGKVVLIGIGKSGLIAQKISATLSSTGTPSLFLNAAECAHGDLGVITNSDVIWCLSNSGRSSEVLTLLPYFESLNIPVITMVGEQGSPLEKVATQCVVLGATVEADPDQIVPTSSTTLMLAVGDAIAVALMRSKGISRNQFAMWHPGGWLGKRLATRVKHLAHTAQQCPLIHSDTLLRDALHEMTRMRLGCLVSEVSPGQFGIFTDGDLRRALETNEDVLELPLSQFLKVHPISTHLEALAQKALESMETYKVTQLIVLDDSKNYAGVLHIHDLLELNGT